MRRTGRIIKRIVLWTLGLLVLVLLLSYILIQLPSVQDYARQRAIVYLQEKIGTPVEVDRLRITFPKNIVLEGVYFEDQKGDTLFAGEKLLANISLFKLLRRTIEIHNLELHGIAANVQRYADSTYNFDYIIDSLSGNEPKTASPASKPMVISLNTILLEKISMTYVDEPSIMNLNAMIGHLNARVKEFDLQAQKFSVPKIVLKEAQGSFVQGEPPARPESEAQDIAESSAPVTFDLELGTIDFENVFFSYENALSDIYADADIGDLAIQAEKLDLKNKIIELKEVAIAHTGLAIALGETDEAKVVKEEAKKEIKVQSRVWNVSISDFILKENSIVFDDRSIAPTGEGMDFAHLSIQDLNLHAQELGYGANTFKGQIKSASLREKNGFRLNQVNGDFLFGEQEGHARDFSIETNQSSVKGNIELRYAHFDSLSTGLESIYQETSIRNSRIAIPDILVFAPDLREEEFFQTVSEEIVNLDADIEGRLNNLVLNKIRFTSLLNTMLSTSGKIQGLPDVENAQYDLRIERFNTHSSDVYALLPEETIPEEIQLPEEISAQGFFRGDLREFVTDISVETSLGDGNINGTVGIDAPMYFKGDLRLEQFDIGRMLRQDTSIGRITLTTTADLQDLGTDSLTGNFSGSIGQFVYQGYNYRDIVFEGIATTGSIDGSVSMEDPNLTFTLDAIAQLNEKASPAVEFTLVLKHVDLQALKLMDEELKLSGKANGDFASIDPDSLNGTLGLNGFVIADSLRRVVLDTVSIVSTATSDSNTLRLNTEFLHIEMAGDYALTSLFPAIENSFSNYFDTTGDTIVAGSAQHHFEINAELSYSPLFTQLDSSIESFAPIKISGVYRSDGDVINLKGNTQSIHYGPATFRGLALEVRTHEDALRYSAGWERGQLNDLIFRKTFLEGSILNNEIRGEFTVLDSLERERFHFNASIEQVGSQYVLYLSPEDLLLNYEPWSVSPDNSILFASRGLAVQNFRLSNGEQSLNIRSEPYGFNNPIAFDFRDFRIETITEAISGDSLLAGGLIDGSALLRDYFSAPVFTADLDIADLSYRGDTIGDIVMTIDNETANTLSANIGISGSGNEVNIEGRYFINDQNIDMVMDITRLRLASVQSFSAGSFTDAHGSIRGDLDVGGTILKPVVEGDIHFDSAEVKITQFNATYGLANEGVSFKNSDVYFNNFTITDAESNTLDVNGVIFTRTFTHFQFDLDVTSKNFKVLNTGPQDNDLYYGTLYLDSRISVGGELNAPEINANLTILDKTKMTVVIPQTAPGIVEREGVVRFVDLDNPNLDSVLTVSMDTLNRSALQGLVAFANIKVTETSEFTLIIDPGTGDFLRLRGDAELSASIDPSGKISLTGTYLLKQGIYELSFNFLKRRFEIRQGSTITWNGEPTSGVMDVTGVYVAEAAPIDLVDRQLAGATQSELNLYKEKLPFELLLKLTGTLTQPQVAFEIALPEGNYSVSPDVIATVRTRLAQLNREESEVNKQAFALVLLNRFISEDPFKSKAGGTSVETYARQSVSKLLTQQLNNLTEDLISGVDLTFDLESMEDYSTGQLQNRTELNVSATKRLLDDRIMVTVGSNFGLEGVEQTNERASNVAGNISVEYQLSKDGRYLLRAYRKNEYEVAVEGYVIETGVSFVIQLDYDKFWEIFKKKK